MKTNESSIETTEAMNRAENDAVENNAVKNNAVENNAVENNAEENNASDNLSYSERQRVKFEKSKEIKRGLVLEAKELASSTEWKEAGEKQKELMDRWKQAGYAAEENESLWEEFQRARKTFFDNRRKHFEELDEQRKTAAAVKRELIARVRSMKFTVESYKEDAKVMDEIFDLWKKAGYAGKDINDALWEEFNQARVPFFAVGKEVREKQEEEFRIKREQKKALIDETEKIISSDNTGKENTERIKAISAEWKEIGYSGAQDSQELWDSFKSAQDRFWERKKERIANRNEEGIKKLKEAVVRRRDRISKLKENTQSLTGRIMEPGNNDNFDQLLKWINENQEEIEKLKAEIKEINERINTIRQNEENIRV